MITLREPAKEWIGLIRQGLWQDLVDQDYHTKNRHEVGNTFFRGIEPVVRFKYTIRGKSD